MLNQIRGLMKTFWLVVSKGVDRHRKWPPALSKPTTLYSLRNSGIILNYNIYYVEIRRKCVGSAKSYRRSAFGTDSR